MNGEPPEDQESDIPGYREELAEGIVVEKMLVRTRLEDAAKGPERSKLSWIVRGAVVIAMIQMGMRNEYQPLITSLVAIYILLGGGDSQIHSRIDAILKLAELDKREAQAAADKLGK